MQLFALALRSCIWRIPLPLRIIIWDMVVGVAGGHFAFIFACGAGNNLFFRWLRKNTFIIWGFVDDSWCNWSNGIVNKFGFVYLVDFGGCCRWCRCCCCFQFKYHAPVVIEMSTAVWYFRECFFYTLSIGTGLFLPMCSLLNMDILFSFRFCTCVNDASCRRLRKYVHKWSIQPCGVWFHFFVQILLNRQMVHWPLAYDGPFHAKKWIWFCTTVTLT